MRRFVWQATLVTLVVACGCSDTPTSLLVRVIAEPSVPAAAWLSLRVVEEQRGTVVDDKRLPAVGRPELPSEIVLYPPSDAPLYLWVRAYDDGGGELARAAERVVPVAGQQRAVVLWLRVAVLADSDGDGIPDVIDRCPGLADPKTGPCPGGDGRVEGGPRDGLDRRDGPRDSGDGPRDGNGLGDGGDGGDAMPRDMPVDQPRCTRDEDCADKNACTTHKCTNGTCAYGAISCPPPSNACKVSRCDTLSGCVVEDAPTSKSCDDGKYCTVADHCDGSGLCVSGGARVCGAPTCNTASCNEALDRCDLQQVSNGTSCSDGDPCTQSETCQSGVCAPPSGATISTVYNANIHLSGQRAIAIDSQGGIHTVFSDGGNMRYAWRAPGQSTFSSTQVRFSPIGPTEYDWASIAFDAGGTLHLAFFDDNSSSVRYARLAPGQTTWPAATSTIAPADGWVSLAVANGRVHVVYVQSRALRYAARTTTSSGAWNDQLVDAAPASASSAIFPEVVVDAQGKIHIAYAQGTYPIVDPRLAVADRLRYATDAASSNFVATSPSSVSGDHGSWPSIGVAQNGAVHIAQSRYATLNQNQAQLYVTSKAAGSSVWTDTLIDSAGVSYKGLVLDSSGNVHVVYRRFGVAPDELRYATNAGGGAYQSVVLDARDNIGHWLSLTRAPSGQLHAIYEWQSQNRVEHVQLSACP